MLSGPEKAVLFLLSLDEDVAAPIVSELRDADLRKLREVASTMREIPSVAVNEVFREFVDRASAQMAVPRGGLRYLKRLTAGAIGEYRARELFEDGTTSPFARLEAAAPDAVAAVLAKEPPQLVAAILARLEPATAAAVLAGLPEDRQADVVARVARLTDVPAGALEDIAAALSSELPSSEAETLVTVDGVTMAAQILNAAGRTRSSAVLDALEPEDPDLASSVRLAMFRFDDLKVLAPAAMRVLLREVSTERLTTALSGASTEVRDAIFRGLSARAAELIKDDLELLGTVRKAEVEAARTEIVQTALRLEAEGTLDLGRGGE
jgi:flagellar motor switch protein FliG